MAAFNVDAAMAYWRRCFGTAVGTRTPTGDPAWITLDVVTGGFATGGRAAALPPLDGPATFENSNAPWVTEEGFGRLAELLQTGCYTLQHPENAVLLSAAWLSLNGHEEAASELHATVIAPFMDTIRFFPTVVEDPVPLDAIARATLQEVRTALTAAGSKAPTRNKRLQTAFATTVAPLRERAVRLLLATCDHPAMVLPLLATGKVDPACAWPLQKVSAEWLAEAAALRTEMAAVADLSQAQRSEGGCFGLALKVLSAVVDAGSTKTVPARDVGLLRAVLCQYFGSHGAPASERHATYMAGVAAAAPGDLKEVTDVALARLARAPAAYGPSDLTEMLKPVAAAEAADGSRAVGHALPGAVRNALTMGCTASLPALVDLGLIPSAEVLATVGPDYQAAITAAGAVADTAAERLLALTYRAFRQRRSLLLVNYAAQVRVTELPWFVAVKKHAEDDDGLVEAQRGSGLTRAVDDTVALLWAKYPMTATPNKLVSALKDMYRLAGQDRVPLTEELAADIFMGGWSKNFTAAAAESAETMAGTVYARYYNLDAAVFPAVLAAANEASGPTDAVARGVEKLFPALCLQEEFGRAIELGQVVTTHNLVQLKRRVSPSVFDGMSKAAVCRAIFEEILTTLVNQPPREDWRARLKAVKRIAYGVRQLCFFISFCSAAELSAAAVVQDLKDVLVKFAAEKNGRAGLVDDLDALLLKRLRWAVATAGEDPCAAYDAEAQGAPVLGWFGLALPAFTERHHAANAAFQARNGR